MPRRVILCADDFAQTQATIDGILSLAGAGRLSAFSGLVESPLWLPAAAGLKPRFDHCDIGLHFNLTHDVSGTGHRRGALPRTILAAFLRRLGRPRIEAALHRQLDLFERGLGRPPDFLDGHQHVHQLPGVRDALVRVLGERDPGRTIAVRVTVPAAPRGVKAAVIAGLGGGSLRRALLAAGIPHNTDFAGVYGFTPEAGFPALLEGWLAEVRDGGLIMCHPAVSGGPPAGQVDPIQKARERELACLASDAFPEALRRAGVRLARFREIGEIRGI